MAGLAALGLAFSGLSGCGPISTTKSSTAHRGHGTRASSTPMNSAAALNLLERQLQNQGRDMGYSPAGPIAVGYRAGKVRWLVWAATGGGVCQGSGTLGIGPAQTACWPAKALPPAGSPGLAALGQSSASAGRWVTLVAADTEQLRSVICAGTRLTLSSTLSLGASGTLYELVSDWPFHGTATAEVQRPSATAAATTQLHLSGGSGKTCG
jgi:hypothetical protein